MLKAVSSVFVIVLVTAAPALARTVEGRYGPPPAKASTSSVTDTTALSAFDVQAKYPKADNLLTDNGVEISKGGARRPIAPNMDVALEPARDLFDPAGDAKKPVRLLLRVGTSF